MKKLMHTIYIITIFAGVLILITTVGCNSAGNGSHSHGPAEEHQETDADHGHQHAADSSAVTGWSQNLELFMEYPPLLRGESLAFIIHFTKLADFKPVTGGDVSLQFTLESGASHTITQKELLREGIFKPTVFFSKTGTYHCIIRYRDGKIDDSLDIGTLTVYEDIHDIPVAEAGTEDPIIFLKEQQWKVDFDTRFVSMQTIKPSVRGTAEVLPGPGGQVTVTTPVAGIVTAKTDNPVIVPGTWVKRGQVVALLAPPLGGDQSWAQAKSDYSQAKKQYERALRLLNKDALSLREFETIEQRYFQLKAGYPVNTVAAGENFPIVSPITGTVSATYVFPGQETARGSKLMTLVSSKNIRLKVSLFEKDYYQLKQPSGAAVYFAGLEEPFYYTQEQLKPISRSEVIDPRTGTVPLTFSLDNPEQTYLIGQILQVDLYSDSPRQALCVPHSAVYDDDGRQVVFVQIQGEHFIKKYIRTGTRTNGWVEVHSGLEPGERVVSRGGYFVKLAGTSTPIGHGHTH